MDWEDKGIQLLIGTRWEKGKLLKEWYSSILEEDNPNTAREQTFGQWEGIRGLEARGWEVLKNKESIKKIRSSISEYNIIERNILAKKLIIFYSQGMMGYNWNRRRGKLLSEEVDIWYITNMIFFLEGCDYKGKIEIHELWNIQRDEWWQKWIGGFHLMEWYIIYEKPNRIDINRPIIWYERSNRGNWGSRPIGRSSLWKKDPWINNYWMWLDYIEKRSKESLYIWGQERDELNINMVLCYLKKRLGFRIRTGEKRGKRNIKIWPIDILYLTGSFLRGKTRAAWNISWKVDKELTQPKEWEINRKHSLMRLEWSIFINQRLTPTENGWDKPEKLNPKIRKPEIAEMLEEWLWCFGTRNKSRVNIIRVWLELIRKRGKIELLKEMLRDIEEFTHMDEREDIGMARNSTVRLFLGMINVTHQEDR